MRFRFCRSIPSTSSIGCIVGCGVRRTKSEREQQCSVTTDLTHLGNVWTGATPSTLKKRDRIYGLLRLTPDRKDCWSCWQGRLNSCRKRRKKVLAMYYYEGLHLADIAAGFNLSKSQICQIHTEVVNELRKYMRSVWIERGRNGACGNEAARGA
jgi:hypothetical protein